MNDLFIKNMLLAFLAIVLGIPLNTYAQTDQDALMMGKKNLCVAGMVGYNSWTNYWEGTYKRENANIGRVSTTSSMLMFNYGLNGNLNIIASLPYVSTQASRGTLSGLNGLQDLGVSVK